MKLITKENLYETAIKFKTLIEKISTSERAQNLFHNTSKTIVKKKKTSVTNFGDLRGLSIIPSIIMVHGKILAQMVSEDVDRILD